MHGTRTMSNFPHKVNFKAKQAEFSAYIRNPIDSPCPSDIQPERMQMFGFAVPILAIFVVITSYIQTKMISPSGGSADSGQGAQMTKAMTMYMPFFMGYLALTFASGLALYFIATNLATIAQYMINGQANFKNILP